MRKAGVSKAGNSFLTSLSGKTFCHSRLCKELVVEYMGLFSFLNQIKVKIS